MAIIRKTTISSIRLLPDSRMVEILLNKHLVDDITNEIVGTEIGGTNVGMVLKIGVDNDMLRSLLGVDKANLLIANL